MALIRDIYPTFFSNIVSEYKADPKKKDIEFTKFLHIFIVTKKGKFSEVVGFTFSAFGWLILNKHLFLLNPGFREPLCFISDKCFKCSGYGHFARDCKNNSERCYKCNLLGHLAKDCESNLDSGNQALHCPVW